MIRALRRFVSRITGTKVIVFFVTIFLVCVLAICVTVYSQFFYKYAKTDPLMMGIHISNKKNEAEYRELKNNFNKLFTNQFYVYKKDKNREFDIRKVNESKKYVYTDYTIENEDENYYQIDLHLPSINLENDVTKSFNKNVKEKYYDRANNIMRTAKKYTVYKVNYAAYMNEGILSIVIKENYKTGDSSETVKVETFNFNMNTGKKVKLNELIKLKKTDKETVQKKIDDTILNAYKNALALNENFGMAYERDLENPIYKIDKTKSYFLTDEGFVYIIYAYGEYEDTNEMDIVIF